MDWGYTLQSFFTELYFALHKTIVTHSINPLSKVFNYYANETRRCPPPLCSEIPLYCFTQCSNTEKVLLKLDDSGSILEVKIHDFVYMNRMRSELTSLILNMSNDNNNIYFL